MWAFKVIGQTMIACMHACMHAVYRPLRDETVVLSQKLVVFSQKTMIVDNFK